MAEKLLRWLLRVADCGAMRAACAAAMTRRWDGPPADFNLRACTISATNGDGDDDGHPSVAVAVEPAWDNGGCPNARYAAASGFVRVGRRDDDDGRRSSRAGDVGWWSRRGRLPTDDDDDDARKAAGRVRRDETAVARRDRLGRRYPAGRWPLAGTREARVWSACSARRATVPMSCRGATTSSSRCCSTPSSRLRSPRAVHYRTWCCSRTRPVAGVSRMDRGGSTPIASGLSDNERIRGEIAASDLRAVTAMNVDDSDTDSDADANDVDDDDDGDDAGEQPQAQLARRRAAARRRGIGSDAAGAATRLPTRGSSFPSGAFGSGGAVRHPVHGSHHRAALWGPCPSSRARCSARGCFASF